MEHKYIRTIFYGYIVIILSGTLLLSIPYAHNNELSFIDALFTAASATCVTGLIVTSTSENFTFFGEFIILLLIQIGGIGYMTVVSLFFLFVKNSLSMDEKRVVKQSLDLPNLEIGTFVKKILLIVFAIEIIGASILTIEFCKNHDFFDALWHGVFNAISAFNNAGFSLFTDSIMSYAKDTVVIVTLSILIIFGGIGFFVLIEVYDNKTLSKSFTLHTKIMLYGTLFLILFGMAIFLSIEWDNPKTFGEFSLYDKLLNSFFLSVNFRTSGFNSIDIGALKDSSLFFSTIFMMIGGGQGSTAGGIKITTAAILIVTVFFILRNSNQEPNLFKRTIEQKIINKALAIIMFSSFLVLFATLLLVETQNLPFIKILFEVVSAFATVGISSGNGDILSFSYQFDTFGKSIIILLMIAGRVGVFAFGVALMGKANIKHFKHPQGRILI